MDSINSDVVKVLPLSAEESRRRGNYEEFGTGEPPGFPSKHIMDSYPDKILNHPLSVRDKEKLIDSEIVLIRIPNQKRDEVLAVGVENNELFLTKYSVDKSGEPIEVSSRNLKSDEVSYNSSRGTANIPNKNSDFVQGESILYKDQTYQILEVLPRKVLQVKIEESSSMLKVTAKDGLYQSLLKAKSDSLDLKNGEAIMPIKPVLQENDLKLTPNFKR